MSKNNESDYKIQFENLPSEIKEVLSGNDQNSKNMAWEKKINENLPSITMKKIWIGVCAFVGVLYFAAFLTNLMKGNFDSTFLIFIGIIGLIIIWLFSELKKAKKAHHLQTITKEKYGLFLFKDQLVFRTFSNLCFVVQRKQIKDFSLEESKYITEARSRYNRTIVGVKWTNLENEEKHTSIWEEDEYSPNQIKRKNYSLTNLQSWHQTGKIPSYIFFNEKLKVH